MDRTWGWGIKICKARKSPFRSDNIRGARAGNDPGRAGDRLGTKRYGQIQSWRLNNLYFADGLARHNLALYEDHRALWIGTNAGLTRLRMAPLSLYRKDVSPAA